jgi:nucleotide-binding universal stress UspA family protein
VALEAKMFKNVIVGVDQHDGGRDAIALAKRLTEDGGNVTLTHVYFGDVRTWRGSSAAYEAAQRDRALKLLTKAREAADLDAGLRCAGAASVGRGLHVLGEEIGADLIVVGSSRHGLLGRVFLGDDTSAALNGAPCAVAIAPAGYAQEPGLIREIGVGYNESAESEHALAFARKLASELGAKLSAFEAVSLPAFMVSGVLVPVDEVIDDLLAAAHEHVAALEGVEPHAAYGRASEELTLFSASLDLLVVGSRDYGPVGRLFHGSTSHQLARSARCPLLVLTRAVRADAELLAVDQTVV